MTSWHRKPLCGFDIESTGVDPEQDRIVTASVVRYGGGSPNEGSSWLADPGVEIPQEATSVHGVTTECARAYGRTAAAVVEELTTALALAVTAGQPIVAMNSQFDLTMLDREARRHGVRPLMDRVSPAVLDPRVLDKRVDRYRKGGRTLTDLCRHYVVPLDHAHSSDADATAACAVVWKLANRHRWVRETKLTDLHAAQVEWAREQNADLRDYFARTEGKEAWAAGVRLEWPLIPAWHAA
ncbi:exonuclease domain-containing protein [Streptomyces sp. NPDC055912]|uniref:exonuclease domain-containing protein n=1 Tax=Streptomyces sp. NPDC055912 TaxID=3345660 RepID=UPI0035DC6408